MRTYMGKYKHSTLRTMWCAEDTVTNKETVCHWPVQGEQEVLQNMTGDRTCESEAGLWSQPAQRPLLASTSNLCGPGQAAQLLCASTDLSLPQGAEEHPHLRSPQDCLSGSPWSTQKSTQQVVRVSQQPFHNADGMHAKLITGQCFTTPPGTPQPTQPQPCHKQGSLKSCSQSLPSKCGRL